jgi:hypothetical protein
MVRVGKNLTFCIVVILFCYSLCMVESSFAQISKPSVPNFTLTFQDGAVVLSIENQPFDIHNSDNVSFYYNVRVMNAGGYWSQLYEAENTPPTQSSSNSTTLLPIQLQKAIFFPR